MVSLKCVDKILIGLKDLWNQGNSYCKSTYDKVQEITALQWMTKAHGEHILGNEKVQDLEGQEVGWVPHVNVEFIMSNDCIKKREEENKELGPKFS